MNTEDQGVYKVIKCSLVAPLNNGIPLFPSLPIQFSLVVNIKLTREIEVHLI